MVTNTKNSLAKEFFNIEAEKAIIGALLVNNNLFDEINEILKSNHFYVDSHQKIYELATLLIEKGQVAEAITISQMCALDDKYKEFITFPYLLELSSNVYITFNSVKDYASIIKDLYTKRELFALSQNINNDLHTINDVEEILESTEGNLFELAQNSTFNASVKDFATALDLALTTATEARKNHDGISGVATHLSDIDKKLGGLQKSDLIILAGRPSMGKTALATNIAYNVAAINNKDNGAVLIFSLEMSAEQLASRILAQEARIQSDAIRKGMISDADYKKLVTTVTGLKSVPIFVDDSPNVTVSQLRTKCRKFKRKNNLKLVIIDYIQLMHGNRKTDNRVLEISEITRGLKAIAKELNIPIIALSQLSRAVETRDDKKPMLADLRESGSIEQDADVVSFIYRAEYYLSREEPSTDKGEEERRKWQTKLDSVKNLATVILAKNRHGPIGNIDLFFDAHYTVFRDMNKHE